MLADFSRLCCPTLYYINTYRHCMKLYEPITKPLYWHRNVFIPPSHKAHNPSVRVRLFTFTQGRRHRFSIGGDADIIVACLFNGMKFNPRRAGGGAVLRPPPSGFSQIAGKRRRAAPPNFAYLFSHLFRILRQKISTM